LKDNPDVKKKIDTELRKHAGLNKSAAAVAAPVVAAAPVRLLRGR